ncbi:MAG: flagellar export chaperone FliS, partial [Halieaceae bacterium]
SRILAGLQGSLDYERGGEIAVNLGELYGYSIRKLFAANVNIDVAPEHVAEVKSLLEPIAEAWENMDLSKPRQLMAV